MYRPLGQINGLMEVRKKNVHVIKKKQKKTLIEKKFNRKNRQLPYY